MKECIGTYGIYENKLDQTSLFTLSNENCLFKSNNQHLLYIVLQILK